MKIHHAIVETLKKVEIVSTAKIMDILLAGVLGNILTDMKRKLSRDNKQINTQEALDQMEKNIKSCV
jgi:hypothetical protein